MKDIIPPIDHDTPALLIATELVDGVNDTLKQLVVRHRRSFNAFWRNPKATPQAICAALGNRAAMFFMAGGANVNLIASLAAARGQTLEDYLPEKDWKPLRPFTVNPDGTVTLG